MLVCICNCIAETEVRAVAREGVTRVDEVYERLGCQVQCGQCRTYAEEVIDSEMPAEVA